MYTYVQRRACKKENTATYVYIRAGSRTPTRACVHGWVGMEKQCRHRVHGEPTGWVRTECVVVFIGRQRNTSCSSGANRLGILQNRGNGLVFDRPRSKQDHVHREGCGVPQNGGNGLVLECYGRNGGPVHREGCGVSQNGTPRANVLSPSTTSL